MADKINLLSTIGTWVAAGLGLVALLGIVGPLLIWKASRTEKHIALQAIHDSGGFLSSGYRISARTRLFRSIKAPLLSEQPLFHSASKFVLQMNAAELQSKSTTSWVRLGLLICAYNLKFRRGDGLEIRLSKAYLPVHRLWIFALGLAGRYGERSPEHGKRRPSLAQLSMPGVSQLGARLVSTGAGTAPVNLRRYNSTHSDRSIYGNTGTFRIQSGLCQFTAYDPAEIGSVATDTMSPQRVLWLAVGALSTADGHAYNLDDVVDRVITRPLATGAILLRDDASSDAPSLATSFGVSHHPAVPIKEQYTDPQASGRLRACRFSHSASWSDWLQMFLNAYGGAQCSLHGLEEIPLDLAQSPELRYYYASTHIPASSLWIRLPQHHNANLRTYNASKDAETWVIRRQDAQMIANVLLNIPWSSEGYLFGGQRQAGLCLLLSSATKQCIRLLARLPDHIDNFGLPDVELYKLKTAVQHALSESTQRTFDRDVCESFYNLDVVLKDILLRHTPASDVIEVLILTNQELREMVMHSVRRLGGLGGSNIVLDIQNKVLRTPSVFGITQEFPVDLDVIFPRGLASHESITVGLPLMILASLRACMRSLLFESTWDSKPLFDFVMKLPEVAQVP